MVLPKMSLRISTNRSMSLPWFYWLWFSSSLTSPNVFHSISTLFIQIPQHYTCFCKKEFNPANHLWLVPHSCGELCERPLKSQHGLCSHRCMILCHPGPCPPCSQTISTSCECRKSNLRTIRCVQQSWKCGNKVQLQSLAELTSMYLVNTFFAIFFVSIVFEIACMWYTYMQRSLSCRMFAVYKEKPTEMHLRQ